MKYKLPLGWKNIKLKEAADYIARGIPPVYTERNGIKVVNQRCIRNYQIDSSLFRLHDLNKKKIMEEKFLQKNDILINSTGVGTLGRLAQIKEVFEPMTVDSHVTIVRGNNKANKVFLNYSLVNKKRNIEHLAQGSTSQTELSRVRLGNEIKINLPPLSEQKNIADTLSALDDKIEVNNQINENLETQAQAIFKHWFVDFEFPDENGMPYKSSGGEMIDSELGMIPKGWEVKKLKNIVDIKYGKNLPVKNLLSTGYNVFGGNGIIGHYDEYIYEEPEVLIACRGAASGKINISTPKSFVTNNSLVLESSTREVFEYIKGRFTHEDLEKYVTGSAQPQITITNIADVEIIIPDPKTLKKYYDISNSFSNLILKNQIQNQKLSALRDTLLPKLMSGEVRIPLNHLNK